MCKKNGKTLGVNCAKFVEYFVDNCVKQNMIFSYPTAEQLFFHKVIHRCNNNSTIIRQ